MVAEDVQRLAGVRECEPRRNTARTWPQLTCSCKRRGQGDRQGLGHQEPSASLGLFERAYRVFERPDYHRCGRRHAPILVKV